MGSPRCWIPSGGPSTSTGGMRPEGQDPGQLRHLRRPQSGQGSGGRRRIPRVSFSGPARTKTPRQSRSRDGVARPERPGAWRAGSRPHAFLHPGATEKKSKRCLRSPRKCLAPRAMCICGSRTGDKGPARRRGRTRRGPEPLKADEGAVARLSCQHQRSGATPKLLEMIGGAKTRAGRDD